MAGKRRQMLGRLAAGASVLAVLLAIISRFIGANIVITQNSFMNFAIVAILVAIYLVVDELGDSVRRE